MSGHRRPGRFAPGASTQDIEEFEQWAEQAWQIAQKLMAEETLHSLSCEDPACGGVIFPWIEANLPSREEAMLFAAVVMEHCADGVADMLTCQMHAGVDQLLGQVPPVTGDGEHG